MERLAASGVQGKMVEYSGNWSDLGSWASVWDVSDKDENGNAFTGDVIAADCVNSIVRGSDRLIALIGLEDTTIVDTEDALLVAGKGFDQEVKAIVSELGRKIARKR